MSESKWIEHYRAGAWTVGEVIEAGAAWGSVAKIGGSQR